MVLLFIDVDLLRFFKKRFIVRGTLVLLAGILKRNLLFVSNLFQALNWLSLSKCGDIHAKLLSKLELGLIAHTAKALRDIVCLVERRVLVALHIVFFVLIKIIILGSLSVT